MLWLALYIAAMFCIALPVAWFARNEVAACVFVVWGVGQVTYQIGFPEAQTQVLIYTAAFLVAGKIAKSAVCLFTAVLFFPLALASFSNAVGWIQPEAAWWSIYWLAMTQVLSLPFCVDWRTVRARGRAKINHGGDTMLRRAHT